METPRNCVTLGPLWGILKFAKYYFLSIFGLSYSFGNSFQRAIKILTTCGKMNHPSDQFRFSRRGARVISFVHWT